MNLLNEGITNGVVLETNMTRKVTLDGITKVYPVYKVKLENLYFNDKNDRIATWISKYKVENSVSDLDITNTREYNDIIHKFIYDSNPESINKTQNNIELVDQREPGVVLIDGRIIDGNRRFTCLRNLSANNLKFGYFETVILDRDIENNAKQIKMLELMIQHGEESKIDYNPIDRLVGIYNDIIEKDLLTIDEYAQSINRTVNFVKKQVELSELLVEFLETINAPKQFYLAREMDLNAPLVELQGILNRTKDENRREDIKIAVFTNFLMQPHGDMTRFIRKIKPIASSDFVDDFLEEQLEIAEYVLESLPEVGSVNKDIINNEIRGQEEVKGKMLRSLEKADAKVKSMATRNRPINILEKAEDILSTIDINIIKKLDEIQVSQILAQLNEIEEIIDYIKLSTLEDASKVRNKI